MKKKKKRVAPEPGRRDDSGSGAAPAAVVQAPAPAAAAPPLSSKQSQYRSKLDGARFRWLNEMLYTRPGADSLSEFRGNPEQFDVVRVPQLRLRHRGVCV
jgi:ribosomal RNA-processing protein 8